MRLTSTAMTIVLCTAIAACGGSPARPASAVRSAQQPDRDNDGDHNDDDARTLNYGRAATAAETRQATALVGRYFAAAAAGDGAEACALLAPLTVETLAEEGASLTPPEHTCTAVAARIYTREHATFAHKRSVRVSSVRIEGDRGIVLIEFPAIRRELRQIGIRRAGGSWRISELSDGIVE